MWKACEPGEGLKATLSELRRIKVMEVEEPLVDLEDCIAAVQKIKSSVDMKAVQMHQAFQSEFGSE